MLIAFADVLVVPFELVPVKVKVRVPLPFADDVANFDTISFQLMYGPVVPPSCPLIIFTVIGEEVMFVA